jgi:hypothetical protein
MGHQARKRIRGDVLTPGTDTHNTFLCRLFATRSAAGGAAVDEHRVAMAVAASLDPSREVGLAAVAHLSRYRGTSREHTAGTPSPGGWV